MAKKTVALNTEPCAKCEYWKKVSSYESGRACHCLLITGHRNGKHGNKCSTYRPRGRERRGRRAFSLQAQAAKRTAEDEPGGAR
nr:MAG TPA: non-capsid protein [Caudoviricetes sp.]